MSHQSAVAHTPDVKAVYLAAEDLKIAASILYQAYHDDPLFTDIFRVDDEGYESRLRSAIREELNAFWEDGQPMIGLFEQERLLAVACLSEPSAAPSAQRHWHWRLKMLLTAGVFGTRQMLEKEQRVREKIPATAFHMLSFIGVQPDHQHKGLGHLLMGAVDSIVLEHPDSQGVGVYVTLPKCLDFFADGEYEMVEPLQVGKITGSIMFRPRPVQVAKAG